MHLGQIAPDTIFLDLDERLRISSENIKQGELIGRGAFGFVYESACRQRGSANHRNVAVKMLQPIDPGNNAKDSTLAAYKANRFVGLFFGVAQGWPRFFNTFSNPFGDHISESVCKI